MDALTFLLQLSFRSFVVLLPVVVGGLAFRRVTMSKTSNAWIYAVTCLFAAVTTAGLLPWAVGLSASNWVFFILAAFCPAVWFGVTTICDVSRKGSYEPEIADVSAVLFKASRKPMVTPLLLENPVTDFPVPFLSSRSAANIDAPSVPSHVSAVAKAAPTPDELPTSIGQKSVLEVAREMRRNKSSEDRRPKLLPAPSINEIPCIKTSGTA